MRLLHTSDWHLGRTLHGVDLLEHQAAYLDHLVEVAREEGVDAVLVAGDVYDRAVPPVEAVTLLSETLARLSERCAVVLTPGNHDSAARLGFGAGLMRDGVHLRTRVADVGAPVELRPRDRSGRSDGAPVLVYGLPYLDPDGCRHALASGDVPLARSHESVTRAAMDRVRADLATRTAGGAGGGVRPRAVVLAHAFVLGGQASESERDIRVGGVDHVPADVFAGVDYVALGHLHGPQRVSGPPGVVLRYSGSPLAYSFSEQHHAKSTVLLELDRDGVRGDVRLVPAPVPRRLSDVTGTMADLLGAAGDPFTGDWVRVVVTDAARPAELFARVRRRFPHALVVQHRPPAVGARSSSVAVTAAHDPVQVAAEFVEHVTGGRPSDAEAAVLRAAFEHVAGLERSA
ncbi:exonuclease SbcCD subunit D [Cellulomonas aerilata]|uniref:Nuclease SbcCD subunit D n=1 Tax=Cellulomonas aerilata TaxID=515326 RepID=A0A512D805_9CELL|nr:exonuclease SbcCD subunit D C-terminal domain-containing protein [Cellulomonas aerilata]GEO32410.1 nuclease SbcCD subunit D [Cellulomonas aerilata]